MDFSKVVAQPDVEQKQESTNSSWQMITTENNNNEDISTTTTATTNDDDQDTAVLINSNEDDIKNTFTPQTNEPHLNVSSKHIYIKSQEYDLIENQLAQLEAQGLQQQKEIVEEDKLFKRQIKQSVKNKNDDDTDDYTNSDDYKDLSSTTNSNPNPSYSTHIGTIYEYTPWYKNKQIIVGIGIAASIVGIFVIYKYYLSTTSSGPSIRVLKMKRTRPR